METTDGKYAGFVVFFILAICGIGNIGFFIVKEVAKVCSRIIIDVSVDAGPYGTLIVIIGLISIGLVLLKCKMEK